MSFSERNFLDGLAEVLDVSPSSDVFWLRVLVTNSVFHGLPVIIPFTAISRDLYKTVRSLILLTRNGEVDVSRDDIISRLSQLPIEDAIIALVMRQIAPEVNIHNEEIKRYVLFAFLVREINPAAPIDSRVQQYINMMTH